MNGLRCTTRLYEHGGIFQLLNQTRSFAVRVRPAVKRAAPISRQQPPPSVPHPHPFPSAPSFFESLPPTQDFDHATPVKFPPRKFSDTLSEKASASSVLANPMLIVNRQVEMLNVFLGAWFYEGFDLQTLNVKYRV